MKQDFNFLSGYRLQNKMQLAKAKNRAIYSYIAVTVVIFAVIGIGIAAFAFMNANDSIKISELKQQINDNDTVKQIHTVIEEKNKLEALRQDYSSIEKVDSSISAAAQLSGEQLSGIYSALPQGTVVSNMSYQNGTVNMDVISADKNQCNVFAGNVSLLSFVENVKYQGFSSTDKGTLFSVSFTVKGYAAAAEEGANNND